MSIRDELIGQRFPVLDKGHIALLDVMGSDQAIADAARTSYGRGTRKLSEDRDLIRFLYRRNHSSPFEMASVKFHIRAPIFVVRQIERHRAGRMCEEQSCWDDPCLAAGTKVYFDCPKDIRRGIATSKSVPIEELYRRCQAAKEGRKGSWKFWNMNIRQMNESTGVIAHSRVVDVFANGEKPCFRVSLANGRTIECTANHKFLFSDGWRSLSDGIGLSLIGDLAVWNSGEHYVFTNGSTVATPPLYRSSEFLVGKLSKIETVEFIGNRETYDIEVEGPYHNFVANGIITHNSVNEYSARFSEAITDMLATPPQGWRKQSLANKQASAGTVSGWPEGYEFQEDPEAIDDDGCAIADGPIVVRVDPATGKDLGFRVFQQGESATPGGYLSTREADVQAHARQAYEERLAFGVAREQARKDLPQSCYTEAVICFDLRNLLHFSGLRMKPDAQPETQSYARTLHDKIIVPLFPATAEAFEHYTLRSLTLSALDIEAACQINAGHEAEGVLAQLFDNKRERSEARQKLFLIGVIKEGATP